MSDIESVSGIDGTTDVTVQTQGSGDGSLAAASRSVGLALFGDRLRLAEQFAVALAGDGVLRGLIGPREAERIWERHLFNCGVVAALLPERAYVIDVGSGAGLPGIALAVARPDIEVVLVEPLSRRTVFLEEVVDSLGLTRQVAVVRARADEIARDGAMFHVKPADVVTARGVAPLDRLAGWCLPLAAVGGRLLAMKGTSAAEEIENHRAAIARLGGGEPAIRMCGAGLIDPPATVVEITKERSVIGAHNSGARRAKTGRRGQN